MKRHKRPSIPAATIHPVYLAGEEIAAEEAGGNHLQRRCAKLADRRQAKQDIRIVTTPLTESMIPAGSQLSNETLAAIRAGKYGLAQPMPPKSSTSPTTTYAQKLKQRQKANKLRLETAL